MKEYFILFHNYSEILAVFETLLEALSWKPPVSLTLQGTVYLKRVKRIDDLFTIQTIEVSKDIYRKT
jgi:hypothetical protein